MSELLTVRDRLRSMIDTPDTAPGDGQVPAYSAATDAFLWGDGGGGGASDHGALDGLLDDDHAQYHTDARALAWLATRTTADLAEGANLYHTDARADARVAAAVDATVAALVHSHAAADVASGTMAAARLGSGTADATTFLRGDATWASPPDGTASLAFSFGMDGTAPADGATTANSRRVNRAHTLVSASIHLESAAATGAVVGDVEASTDGGATWASLWAVGTANRPTLASTDREAATTAFDATAMAAGTRYRGVLLTHDASAQAVTIELEYR